MRSTLLATIFSALLVVSCGYHPQVKQRTFHFNYEVSVLPIENEGAVELWIPLPHNGPHQTISNVTIESLLDASVHIDTTYGNALVYLSTNSPPPAGFTVSLSFDVNRKEQRIIPSSLPSHKKHLYLAPKSKVPRDNRFDEIVQTVLSPHLTTMENGRLLYDHTLDRMTYDKSGEGWGLGDAIYACDMGRGNCTDFHSLFNALVRTADIPARFLIGFPLSEEEEGTIGGYHCWAEFHDAQRGWVPVDISQADKHPEREDYLFGNLDPNRVLFTMGRDIVLVPKAQGGPVNFFIYPVLEIDGARSDAYTRKFTYHSLRS
ncbi:MAG: transglutaminase domain-containing protein [Candidatus Neomarinimicrobiota bacterium]